MQKIWRICGGWRQVHVEIKLHFWMFRVCHVRMCRKFILMSMYFELRHPSSVIGTEWKTPWKEEWGERYLKCLLLLLSLFFLLFHLFSEAQASKPIKETDYDKEEQRWLKKWSLWLGDWLHWVSKQNWTNNSIYWRLWYTHRYVSVTHTCINIEIKMNEEKYLHNMYAYICTFLNAVHWEGIEIVASPHKIQWVPEVHKLNFYISTSTKKD